MEMEIMGSGSHLRSLLASVPESQLPNGIKGGDTKVIWNRDNAAEIENARRTFNDLRAKRFLAFAVDDKGEKGRMLHEFDPYMERIILVPPMAGG
jgi:hypothetical protein